MAVNSGGSAAGPFNIVRCENGRADRRRLVPGDPPQWIIDGATRVAGQQIQTFCIGEILGSRQSAAIGVIRVTGSH